MVIKAAERERVRAGPQSARRKRSQQAEDKTRMAGRRPNWEKHRESGWLLPVPKNRQVKRRTREKAD